MLLLMLFAFVAGAGTAITPCVLPVVPALLSASALGDDKAARKKFREMRTRGLGRYGGRHRQLRRGLTIAV